MKLHFYYLLYAFDKIDSQKIKVILDIVMRTQRSDYNLKVDTFKDNEVIKKC